ncbi:MAG: hypothetical protein AVDCRST_MAG85-1976 [uncultured Solirubrobacteraceae bacterium]|uniref:Uncharacterized protein n=1 Tax=uncultured Solirubrobacteraceae bacterium TaxID=1162706 RepID=A0A6J4STD9_9ACTN|nr:MAG: hypothetical protein AVDCRST_MAG85-1976 [uncultured Solirubrobacteraceae bacterium]
MIASISRRLLVPAALLGLSTVGALGADAATANTARVSADTACVSQPFNPKDPTAPLIRCCPPDSECTQFPPRLPELPPATTGRATL